jgi:hypothetical protein
LTITSSRWRPVKNAGFVVLVFAMASVLSGRSTATDQATRTNRQRVMSLDSKAERIDQAYLEADSQEYFRLSKELPHWHMQGLIQKSVPIRLDAMFTEGDMVQEETYYLADGKPYLVVISQWSDADDPKKSGNSDVERRFYFSDGELLGCRLKGKSGSSGVSTGAKARVVTADLAKRATTIARVLAGELSGSDAANVLSPPPPVSCEINQ